MPFILVLALILGLAGRARAAVTLISFTAAGHDGYILIEWETATELDNAGFYIQASDQENGTYTRISNFIWTESDGLTGASYSYPDNNVSSGEVKWYKLESVTSNQTSEFAGPISATEGEPTPTSTATSTETATLTLTPTETQVNATSTSTATLTPTATNTSAAAYPAPATATPRPAYPGIGTTAAPVGAQATTAVPFQASATAVIQGSLPSPTALQAQGLTYPGTNQSGTFVPLPSISIQYVDGLTGTPELTEAIMAASADGPEQSGNYSGWSRYGTLGFILIIWVLLGGWFWLSFRKLE